MDELQVWRVTKYDPADRDENGRYVGAQDVFSDRGPVEAAYMDAIRAFAEDASVDGWEIREPHASLAASLGGVPWPDELIADVFGAEARGFHDGAHVGLDDALQLMRWMLREQGWCRLEAGAGFFMHGGWDMYTYIGTAADSRRALDTTRRLGLFAEPIDRSPYEDDDDDDRSPPGAAGPAFWDEAAALIQTRGAVTLQEGYLGNIARWHRLTADTVRAVRAGLAPRSWLCVWPDVDGEVATVLDTLPRDVGDGSATLVWRDRVARLGREYVIEPEYEDVRARLGDGRATAALSIDDDRQPLLTAVLPDHDGVVRAPWRR